MSAATVFPEIKDPHLQNLCYAILTSTRAANGVAAAGFTDRLGKSVPVNSALSGGQTSTSSQAFPGREVEIIIRINPDGLTATAKIVPQSPAGLQSVEGQLDPTLLAGQTL